MPISCGIDFGTSNSTCAIARAPGDAGLIALEKDSPVLPSALFLGAKDNSIFGRAAISAYIDDEEGRLMRGLKSVLGTSLMEEKTLVNNRARSFIEILSIFLRHIKLKAEAAAGQEIENVVMGRPVHFHDNNPEADRRSQNVLEKIAANIGFKNIQFQYEPIAAAFSHERKVAGEKLSLVIDIGGGTSDFTVIRLAQSRSGDSSRAEDILASSGTRTGGTNFDYKMSMKMFMPYLGLGSEYQSSFDEEKILEMPAAVYGDLSEWAKVNRAQTPKAISSTKELLRHALEPEKIERLLKLQEERLGHAFLQKIEGAKIDLTAHEKATADFTGLGFDFEATVSRKQFETTIAEYIKKISASMKECLKQAGVKKEQIELIILTGGSTELPIIRRLVAADFPNAEISQDDKFGSVGLGLAYQAGAIFRD